MVRVRHDYTAHGYYVNHTREAQPLQSAYRLGISAVIILSLGIVPWVW